MILTDYFWTGGKLADDTRHDDWSRGVLFSPWLVIPQRRLLLARDTGFRILLAPLRNFSNSVYPSLPASFGGDTKHSWSLPTGVCARGSKMSHTRGKCVTRRGLRHSERDNSVNNTQNHECSQYSEESEQCTYNFFQTLYSKPISSIWTGVDWQDHVWQALFHMLP